MRTSRASLAPQLGKPGSWRGLEALEPRVLLSAAIDFVHLEPLGGLMYVSEDNLGALQSAADVQEFTFFVEAGQTISALATPVDPAAMLDIELVGLAGPITSWWPGQPARLGTVAIDQSGVYTISISGDGATAYDLDIYRNATVERIVGDSGQQIPLAIDGSAIALGGGRFAVIGNSAPFDGSIYETLQLTPIDAQAVADDGINYTLDPTSLTNNASRFGSIALERRAVLEFTGLGAVPAGSTINNATFNMVINQYTGPLSSIIEFHGYVGNGLLEVQDATVPFNLLGQTELLDALGPNSVALNTGYIQSVFDAGQTLGIMAYQGGDGQGSFYSTDYSAENSPYLSLGYFTPTVIPDIDEYTIDLTGKVGDHIDVVLAGLDGVDYSNQTLELIGVDGGTALATATVDPLGVDATNFDLAIFDFVVPADGVYTIRVTADIAGDYGLVVTDALLFNAQPNEGFFDPHRNLDTVTEALGYLSGGAMYDVTLEAGMEVSMGIEALFTDPQGTPGNALLPTIIVFDSALNIIAADTNEADSQGARVDFITSQAGLYTILLSAKTGPGEYLLDVQSQPVPPTPGQINGLKWHDTNADGVRDADEPGLGGVTIYLDLNDDLQFDAATEPSTVTRYDDPATTTIDEAGTYTLTDVPVGDYVVREVLQAGYEQTYPAMAGGSGELTFVQALIDGGSDGSGQVIDGLNRVESVTISPDGAHVYAAAFSDKAIAVFSRDPITGELTFVEALFDGIDGVDGLSEVSSVVVSPDGNHVYAAARADSAVAVFSRNTTTGELTFVEIQKNGVGGVNGLGGARTLAISPDGGHIYVGSQYDDALAVFSRDATTGALTFVQSIFDNVSGVDGLNHPSFITLDPDGSHVYVAATIDHALSVFSRNAITGELTFVEVHKNGQNGVDGLGWTRGVTVSPDGTHVYATSQLNDAVTLFSRDAATGALTFVSTLKNGQLDGAGNTVTGLDGAIEVKLSPDGRHAYVTGSNDNAVTVFSRDTSTGALTFVERLQDGGTDGQGNSLDNLAAAWSVAISLDGRHVYAGAFTDDALTVFSRQVIGSVAGHAVTVGDGQIVNDINFGNRLIVLPEITISDAAVVEGDSGTTALSFNITISAEPLGPVVVNFTVTPGSATAGEDYQAIDGQVVFNVGLGLSVPVTVDIIGDTQFEADETILVNLTLTSGPAVITDAQALGTILNDDVQNQAPSAAAGPDQSVTTGDTVQLDGSASSDPDSDPLTYSWTIILAPGGSSATLSNADTAAPTFVPDVDGDYTVQLTVSDGDLTDVDTIAVAATPAVNETITVTKTAYNAKKDVLKVEAISSLGADAGLTVRYFSGTTASAVTAMTYNTRKDKWSATFTSLATEPDRVEIRSVYGTLVEVILNEPTANQAPSADAGPDQMVLTGTTVQLDGSSSSDPDNDPLTYTWVLLTSPTGSNAALSSASSISPSFLADVSGDYTVQLTVSDGQLSSTSTLVVTAADTINETINITKINYNAKRELLKVEATSSLGADAGLTFRYFINGTASIFLPMTYNAKKGVWTINITSLTIKPDRIEICSTVGTCVEAILP